MLKLSRISIVGLHVLLLSHVAESFVLLTANIEDVKKIARKFVSDSLAEKITEFIAKATETMAEEKKVSEDSKDHDSSQVSVENKMYDPEKTFLRSEKEKKLIPKSSNTDKERHKEVEQKTSKPEPDRAEPKPVHGRSRYIDQEKKSEATTKEPEENNDKQTKEKVITSTPSEVRTKRQHSYKTKRRFKLLSVNSKENKKVEENTKRNPKRSMVVTAADTENDPYYTEDKFVNNKPVNYAQYDNIKKNTDNTANNEYEYDNERDKHTEYEAAGASKPETDDYDDEVNNVIPMDEAAVTSRSLVRAKDYNDENWWEKEIPTNQPNDADVHAKGKSWF